jgi:hypothetical protein
LGILIMISGLAIYAIFHKRTDDSSAASAGRD